MKNYLRKWLGIAQLESAIGKAKKVDHFNMLDRLFFVQWGGEDKYGSGLRGDYERLEDKHQELSKKFNALLQNLKLEYVEKDFKGIQKKVGKRGRPAKYHDED